MQIHETYIFYRKLYEALSVKLTPDIRLRVNHVLVSLRHETIWIANFPELLISSLKSLIIKRGVYRGSDYSLQV